MTAYVYIMASKKNGTLYIGVTNDLVHRISQHRCGEGSAFARKYGIRRLVHVEPFEDISTAIAREKQIKNWKRAWKVNLIEEAHPDWNDLFSKINQ